MTPPISQTPNMVFLDEVGDYIGGQDDDLKETLRGIEGVPNAVYFVKAGQVFVFDKLVKLVKEQLDQAKQMGQPIEALARSLIPLATVSATEAVESWGIVPEPYDTVAHPAGGLLIRHRPFNARLPVSGDMREVFARLLMGEIQPGVGDFTYRGQPMTLCAPLDTALLPPRPAILCVEEDEDMGYTALGSIAYEPGFEPVSEGMFEAAKELERVWENESVRARRYTQSHTAEIWARASTLQLDTLNDPTDEVPDYGQEDVAVLRALYPELSMLADGTLYALFDRFQTECCYNSGWTTCRDDEFLFYLLVAGRQQEQVAREIGQWSAYALLRGDSLDAAIAFGREAASYDIALSSLVRRIADAMRFIAVDKSATELHGRAISTAMDAFRLGRKFNSKLFQAEQNPLEMDSNHGPISG